MTQRIRAMHGRLLASTIFASAALAAAPAHAQGVNQPTQAADESSGEPDIIVTGTLVRNPNLVASAPVNVVGEEEIELQQANVAEELLRELPGAVPSIGSAINNGNGGASFVNLRGLGVNRNVVLVDGVRLVPSGLGGVFDLNNIPLALIQRVDVLTGGASTTYGADAVSGVVNFITRQDFAGIDINLSEQITERGDGNVFRGDVTMGASFDDGRGNVILSLGYQEADPVYQGARPFSIQSIESYLASCVPCAGSPTSVPSAFSFQGGAGPVGTPGRLNGDQQIDPATGAVRGTGVFSAFNFNPYNLYQTPFERFNIYGAGSYQVSDALEFYSRGLFSKQTVSTNIAPSGAFAIAVNIPLSNPFMPAGIRAQFCANNDFGAAAGIQPLTPAQCAAAAAATNPNDPAYREVVTSLRRRAVELGPRVSDYRTTIFDYRLGARGGITDSIDWDLFGSYGESENIESIGGYALNSRIRQALRATNPNTCLVETNGCVPINVFGPAGAITPAMADFITESSTVATRVSLAQARGTVRGDFGWTVPWATEAVNFALGGEFREYRASQASDALAQSGDLGGSGGADPNIEGGFNAYEAFGELIIPIVADRPFFDELTVEGGIRYSSYNIDAPGNPSFTTTTWKVGGTWAPVDGVRFRANYARAIRAPNIAELFSPVTTGLTNLAIDPCAGAAPLNNGELRAICLAQGAPAFTLGSISNPAAAQANATGGGNPAVTPEKARTLTVGVVFQPNFVPGLSMSIDYYNILITESITTPSSQDAITACFGGTPSSPPAGASTSAACTVIRRNPLTGGLDGDGTPGIFLPLSNLGRIQTSGIDLTLNYRRDLGFAGLDLSFVGNWTDESTFQAGPTSLDRDCVGFYSVSCVSIQPEFQFSQRTTLSFGDIDLSLLWRYTHSVEFEPAQFEADLAAALAAPGDCPDATGADPNGCLVDPAFRRIGAAHYFDLTGRFAVDDHLTITLSVQNLFDKSPPIVGNSIGSTVFNSGNTYPANYDALGRRFVASARVRF